MKAAASVNVANLINQWYVHIKKRDVSNAVELRDRIKGLLNVMEEDQDVLLYFKLLDYRFRVLMEDVAGEPQLPPIAEDRRRQTVCYDTITFSLKECMKVRGATTLKRLIVLELPSGSSIMSKMKSKRPSFIISLEISIILRKQLYFLFIIFQSRRAFIGLMKNIRHSR